MSGNGAILKRIRVDIVDQLKDEIKRKRSELESLEAKLQEIEAER